MHGEIGSFLVSADVPSLASLSSSYGMGRVGRRKGVHESLGWGGVEAA